MLLSLTKYTLDVKILIIPQYYICTYLYCFVSVKQLFYINAYVVATGDYNGIIIQSIEKDLKIGPWHCIFASPFLILALFMMIWGANIIRSSIEYDYFDNSWLYILITVPFAISILWEVILIIGRAIR